VPEIRDRLLAMAVFAQTRPEALSPQITDDIHQALAGYAAQIEEEYGRLAQQKALMMTGLEGSEASRLREWDASVDGQRMIELKHTLQAIDRVIAALKERMRRFNNEAFNKY
jgi:hypothetical protein